MTRKTKETFTYGTPAGNSESGRSMVEMLGVLAIIGVLTVGGVVGYDFAMTRYRANEIIENVKQRATVGSGQYLQGMEAINLSEFPNTILEYETEGFDGGLNDEKGLFSIDVEKVPQAVCQDILDRNWTWPAGIFVNERDIPCPEGNSKMTFVFAADLNERTGATAYDPCLGKTCCRITDPNTLAFEEGQNLSNKECRTTADNNLTCCTTPTERTCYFERVSIDRYGPHQNTIADCTNDRLHRCDDDLNCVCTTRCTNPDKVQNPNTCACTCPTGVPNADDSACVECLTDTDCTDGKVCNMADNTCACPESGSVPQNTCYTTTEHAATEACPAYTTYEPLTCAEPKTVCDVANNTCKCPACTATGMTQNTNTCECTCPSGYSLNEETKSCEASCPGITLYSEQNKQGTPVGHCCSGTQKLVQNTENTLFSGYKQTGTKTYGCCPKEKAYGTTTCCSNDQAVTTTGCCASDRVYNGNKCCAEGNIILGSGCCTSDKVYSKDGQDACCDGDLFDFKGQKICCPQNQILGTEGVCYRPFECSSGWPKHANKKTKVTRSDVQLAARANGYEEAQYIYQLCLDGKWWNAWVVDSTCSGGYFGYQAVNAKTPLKDCGKLDNGKETKCRCIDGHSDDDNFHYLTYIR